MTKKEKIEKIRISNHAVELSHPHKTLYPDSGYAKRDVVLRARAEGPVNQVPHRRLKKLIEEAAEKKE